MHTDKTRWLAAAVAVAGTTTAVAGTITSAVAGTATPAVAASAAAPTAPTAAAAAAEKIVAASRAAIGADTASVASVRFPRRSHKRPETSQFFNLREVSIAQRDDTFLPLPLKNVAKTFCYVDGA